MLHFVCILLLRYTLKVFFDISTETKEEAEDTLEEAQNALFASRLLLQTAPESAWSHYLLSFFQSYLGWKLGCFPVVGLSVLEYVTLSTSPAL